MTKWYKRISCLLLVLLMLFGALASAENVPEKPAGEPVPYTVETVADDSVTESNSTQEQADEQDPSGEQPSEQPEEPEQPETPEEVLSLSPASVSVQAGEARTIRLVCNVEDSIISAASSNTGVAEVSEFDSGFVMIDAVAKGSCTVTVTTANGYTASCSVTVTAVKDTENPNGNNNNNNNSPNNPGSTTPNNTNSGSSSGSTSAGTSIPTTTTAAYTMPDNIPSSVALTFSCSLGKYTDDILDDMETYDTYGTFFVLSKDIYRKDDRVRRIVGQGNSIGITLTQKQVKSASKALRALQRANTRLSTVCGVPTRLVTVEGGSEQLSQDVYTALTKAGYRVWDWDYSVTVTDVKTDAKNLESAMDTTKRVVVRMDTGKQSAQLMKDVLGYMNYASIPTKALVDSDRPVCTAAKTD